MDFFFQCRLFGTLCGTILPGSRIPEKKQGYIFSKKTELNAKPNTEPPQKKVSINFFLLSLNSTLTVMTMMMVLLLRIYIQKTFYLLKPAY